MSIADFTNRIEQMQITVERATTTMNTFSETITRLDTKLTGSAERNAQAVNVLLSKQGFSYLFDIWLGQAVANPNDPGLSAIENYIRTWTGAGSDVDFGTLRRMIRKRTESVQRARGRDARLTESELNDLLDEVMGR